MLKEKQSIFNKIFKMKYGSRSEGYDAETQVPKWDKQFDAMLENMNERKELFDRIERNYEWSAAIAFKTQKQEDIINDLKGFVADFEKLSNLTLFHQEFILAQEGLILILGLKTCIECLSLATDEACAEEIFTLFRIIQRIIWVMYEGLRPGKYPFWHAYGFKIGLHQLSFVLKAKEKKGILIKVNSDYSVIYGDVILAVAPVEFIVAYLLPTGDRPVYAQRLLENDIRRVIKEK